MGVLPPPSGLSASTPLRRCLSDRLQDECLCTAPSSVLLAASGVSAFHLQDAKDRLPQARAWSVTLKVDLDSPVVSRPPCRWSPALGRFCLWTSAVSRLMPSRCLSRSLGELVSKAASSMPQHTKCCLPRRMLATLLSSQRRNSSLSMASSGTCDLTQAVHARSTC